MTQAELARLHELVRTAAAHVKRPWEPGETSRPVTFFTDHLEDEGWYLGWALVAALRAEHADLFNSYTEQRLHLDALEFINDQAAPPSIETIAEALRTGTVDQGPWLVAIPLANVTLDAPWCPVGPTAALWRVPDADGGTSDGQLRSASEDDARAAGEVFKHLGDRISPGTRTLKLSSGRTMDTGRTVSLLCVASGSAATAVEAARARAQYALATWAILAPPADWHLLPDLGVWTPQPFLHQRLRHKLLESGNWIAQERRAGGDYREWAPYALDATSPILRHF